MINFKKKHKAPKLHSTDAAGFGKDIDAILASLSLDERIRLVAGTETNGEVELRFRLRRTGPPGLSIWIMASDGQGILLVDRMQGSTEASA